MSTTGQPSGKMTLHIPEKPLLSECAEMLENGQEVVLTARGESMYPFVRDGDKVLLKSMEVHKGDIVLGIDGEGGFVMHRVMGTDGKGYVLMGDANLRKKEYCTSSGIKGSVISIMHNGKTRLCSSLRERMLSGIWRSMLPARRFLLFVLRGMGV